MSVTADWFSAIPVISEQLGFVANADLLHFNPRLELIGQSLHQLAKIDTILRDVVDNNPFAAKQMLEIDQIHRQIQFLDDSTACLKLASRHAGDS